jgi:3-isopropylmalate dehydrogenase
LLGATPLKPEHALGTDLLIVRENLGGVYQGRWSARSCHLQGRIEQHTFEYAETQVRAILAVACRIAARRSGRLAVVIKEAGVPGISSLWQQCAKEQCDRHQVACTFLDVDLAGYKLIRHPRELDVLVTPNLFGDILVDLGAILVGSRGLSFSGNFSADGCAVFQTNHGAAYDLVGKDAANPIGQILSLAMLLAESFGLSHEAGLIEAGVAEVLHQGYRTFDIMQHGCRLVGTRAITGLIAEAVDRLGAGSCGQETLNESAPGIAEHQVRFVALD